MTPFFTTASHFRHRTTRPGAQFFLAVFLLFAIVWYAVAANALVSLSYRFNDLTEEMAAVEHDLELLSAALALGASPEALEARAQQLGFSRIVSPSYLAVPGTVVAQR